MASFSDSIKLTIDIVTGGAKGSLRSLSQEISQAEGSWNKMKTGATGAFDLVKKNAATFAVGAGAAIAGFGLKAAKDMEQVALGAGELRDALGLSADEASRWQEVAGDLGISVGTLQTAMGRMLKVAGTTPEVFAELGVQIARTADGSVDASGTFLNVIGALNGMTDPAQRAAAAQKLLGKSWQDASELIATGAEGVKARLDEVSGAKIVDDNQIGQARDMRDAMDNMNDALENASLTIGRAVVPAITDLANTASQALGPLSGLAGALTDINKVSQPPADKPLGWLDLPEHVIKKPLDLKGNWDLFARSFSESLGKGQANVDAALGPGLEAKLTATNAALGGLAGAAGTAAEGFGDLSAATQQVKADQAAARLTAFKDALADITSESDNAKAAAEGFSGALDTLFGSALNVDAAADATRQTIADLANTAAEAAKGTDGYTTSLDQNTEAGRVNRDLVRDAVGAIQDYTGKLAESGATSDNVSGQYAFMRAGLVNTLVQFGMTEAAASDYISTLGLTPDVVPTAVQLSGAESAKASVLDYLHNHLDRIPSSKLTEILGHLQRGEFEAARSIIDSIPRSVTVSINANYGADLGPIGGTNRRAAGGPVRAGEAYIVGDKFGVNSPSAEVFVPDRPGNIYPKGTMSGGGALGGGGGGILINLTVNAPAPVGLNPVTHAQEIVKAMIPALETGMAGPVRKALGLKPVGAVA